MTTAKVFGRTEIAGLLQVDSRTPHAWFARKLLPPPDHDAVNGTPAWDRDTILAWAAVTGRLPECLVGEANSKGMKIKTNRRGGRDAKALHGS